MTRGRVGAAAVVAGLGWAVAGCTPGARGGAARAPEPVAIPVAAVTVRTPAPERLAIEQLRALADSIVGDRAFANARWGILVVDPARRDTLVSLDADRLFMPASNQKLLTGAAALVTFGAGHRWRTPVLLDGRQRGATFTGDLVLVGAGDPSWSDSLQGGDAARAFDPVADALRARGITRIRGAIRAGGDRFTGPTTGFGWEVDDLDAPYGAPVDELLFNEGAMRVVVHADARGRVEVRTPATGAYPPRDVRVAVAPPAGGGARAEPVTVRWDTTGTRLVVEGTLAAGDSVVQTVSYRSPADAVRAALTERLRRRGIGVEPAPGPRRAAIGAAASRGAPGGSPAGDTLVVLASAPLGDVVRRMQKPSQNQVAELLFRSVGVARTGSGDPDSARAAVARLLDSLGVRPDYVAVRDGSGLSRHDYVTPRALVTVLDAMLRSPDSTAWLDALPIAGVDGTLASRMRGTPAERAVRAKTGSVDKARSLSGYVTTRGGQRLLFAMLCNNYTVANRDIERVHEVLLSRIAQLELGGAAAAR